MSQGESARISMWLERLQGGDERALNDLILHFERRLRSLTRKMIREFPLVHIGFLPIDSLVAGSNSSSRLDQWTEFHEAAAGLLEPQREVFDLIWYHGFSQDDVASVQHVSVRTVKKRWNAARLAIYDSLGGQLPGT